MQHPDITPKASVFARPGALTIQLLGACRISLGDRVCDVSSWRLRKAAHLVKQLALAPGRQLHRDQLFERLWPGLDPDAASNLRVTLHFARKLLTQDGFDGGEAIQSRGQLLALFPDQIVWTDAQAFETAAEAARATGDPALYQAALDLYAGDLLPEDRFEDWASDPRESLRALRIELLLELARIHERRNDDEQAIRALRDIIDLDPAHEPAHAALMRVYAATGRRVHALRQYLQLRDALLHGLDVEPAPEVTRFYERLLTQRAEPETRPPAGRMMEPTTGAGTRTGVRPPATPSNLPAQLTSFVGRREELAAVHEATLRSRLVTLTGPGGVGKTRLSIEAAERLTGQHPDGVWFVDLSTLSDPSRIPHAVATALGVADAPHTPLLATLSTELADDAALLVLDNCEHLIEASASVVATLLRNCPRLHIIATSREPLWVDGESVWPVPPLAVPQPEQWDSVDALREVESVRLFTARARAVAPGFALSDDTCLAVADICLALEGTPLAIELAATRVRGLTLPEIAQRLDDALGLLSGGNRDRPRRQRSLRDAIEWSHDLLPDIERRVFRRMAVFAGSFSLDAVQAVCLLPEDRSIDLLIIVFALLDKSLLVAEEHDGETRYRMLGTIRQYAAERLEQAGETGLIQDRRRDWFLALAEQAELGMIGADVQSWMRRLMPEIDSIRLVLQHSSDEGDPQTTLRLASRLWSFWLISGRLSEGRAWIEPLLTETSRDARALAAAGLLAQRQGDYRQAIIWTEACLPLARASDDRLSLAYALTNLCLCALYRGDVERAIELAHEGLEISREIGMLVGVPTCLSSLGLAEHWRGNDDAAADYLRQSVAAAREIGFTAFAAWLLGQLADVERDRGNDEAARELASESIALGHEVDDIYGPALGRRVLGRLAANSGNIGEARELIAESLSAFQRMGYKLRTIECLEDLGELALARLDAAEAIRLLSAAGHLRAVEESPPPERRQAALEHARKQARARLSDGDYATAQSRGRAMSLEQAVQVALDAAV